MALTKQEQICILKLPWKKSVKNHSLHSICSRICSFPPALVKHFILNYSVKGDIVFDPFSGKGTLPLEALICGRIGYGNDVSPEAYILTKAKCSRISKKRLFYLLNQLKKKMGFIKSVNNVDYKIRTFYSDNTLKQILEIKEILKSSNSKYSIFIKALLLGIIHGSTSNSLSLRCSHSYSMSPNYVKNYAKKHNLIKPEREVIECLKQKASVCLKNPFPNIQGKAFDFDSRKIKLKDNSINLIISSPPYFGIQTYAYDNWLRLWFLGYDYKDVNKMQVNSNSDEIYGNFMLKSLEEMYRILKPNSHCFIIVGDVKKKTSKGHIIINTARFLEKFANRVGFSTQEVIVDTIPQTKKVLNSSLCSVGICTERILHLKKN